ncbi:MAG: hypothetical protein R2822_27100 [Spirosomataceae bacterium]
MDSVIGVSDMEKSMAFYANILAIDEIVYDKTGLFEDFDYLNENKQQFRRVLLRKQLGNIGPLVNCWVA